MKQKLLITGASGFVGFHLIEAALAKGLEVHAAVRKSSNIAHLSSYNITYTYPDFSSVESLEKELNQQQYNYIIHAAGITKAKNQEEYNKINVSYTINLAKAAQRLDTKLNKMVFISSLAALGPSNEINGLITEANMPAPVTSYGKSKLLAEEQLKDLSIPLIVLRPTAVYGARDKEILIILKTFNNGLEPYIGSMQQRLSFVYVKDLAVASVNALFTADNANGSYNITDGNCYDRYELANIAKRILKKKTLKVHLPLPIVRTLAIVLEKSYGLLDKTPTLNLEKLNELTGANWCCDMERAKQSLHFKPAYNLQKGLTEAIAWYKENKWL